MLDDMMMTLRRRRSLRVGVSAAVLVGMAAPPALAQRGGGDPVLNACQTERAPLVQLDKDYKDLKRSKMGAAIGEGLKQGATVVARGVASGGVPGLSSPRVGGFGLGGVVGLASGALAQNARAPGAAPAATPASFFGPDLLAGAAGLNVPGLAGLGGDKGYAALGVLVAIVGTIDAYAKLKEQEAGGDLSRAAFNMDQDASRQLAVSRQMSESGNALVDCRSRQLNDIDTRLASASNDKDRKAISRERTQYIGALQKDIDLTSGLVDEHTGMAKTFTQGRAMAGGISEADVLGPQAPAYATSASSSRLSMPAATQQASYSPGAQPAAAAPPPAPVQAMVTLRATVVREAPVTSGASVMNLPAGRPITPKGPAQGGWYEIDVAGAPGYVRAADLGAAGAAAAPTQQAASGVGGRPGTRPAAAPAAPPPAPDLASASNIRAYNASVIMARDNGKGRLGSLMTDIQTSQKTQPSFWASLTRWWS